MGNLSRLDHIMRLLMQRKKISVGELASILNAAPTTIRWDLLVLEEKHQITRTRGYTLLSNEYHVQYNGHLRTELFYDEKQRIASKALELVHSHSSIFLDSGMTVLEFAKELSQRSDFEGINIVTNAIDIAQAFYNNNQIFMPSGVLHHYSKVLFGINTASYFKDINADVAFMGTNGLLNSPGLTVPIPHLLDIKKNMVNSVTKVVGMAGSLKFIRNGIYTYCDYEDLNVLITVKTKGDEGAPERLAGRYPGLEIVLA